MAGMADDWKVETRLVDHELNCPFCHQMVEVKVISKIRTSNLRLGSSTSFKTEAIVDVQMQPLECVVTHQCIIKEEKS